MPRGLRLNIIFQSYFLFVSEARGSRLWIERKIRVLYAIANCGLQQKDYELASGVLDQVHDLEEHVVERAKVRSVQGRMFLQLGDLSAAVHFFGEAARLRPGPSAETLIDESCVSIGKCFKTFCFF